MCLSDVNDAALWNTLITSLTLPVPGTPRFLNIGLTSAEIEWSSYFAPSKLDKTAFGFVLEVCEAANKSVCFQRDYERSKLLEKVAKKDADSLIFQITLTTFLSSGQDYIARYCLTYALSV